nr:putative quinol monooxygenase [Mangrovicoccus sp. HB161399]
MLAGLVRDTAAEPGCLSFEIRRDLENPSRFALWERWTSPEALQAHFAQAHTRKVLETGATRVLSVQKLAPLGTVPAPASE